MQYGSILKHSSAHLYSTNHVLRCIKIQEPNTKTNKKKVNSEFEKKKKPETELNKEQRKRVYAWYILYFYATTIVAHPIHSFINMHHDLQLICLRLVLVKCCVRILWCIYGTHSMLM